MLQFFNDSQPLDSEALEYVKTTWSKYFETMYNIIEYFTSSVLSEK